MLYTTYLYRRLQLQKEVAKKNRKKLSFLPSKKIYTFHGSFALFKYFIEGIRKAPRRNPLKSGNKRKGDYRE